MSSSDDETLTGISRLPTPTGGRVAYLFVVASPEGSGRMVRIDKSRVIVGRSPDADVQVQDSSISRHHVILKVHDGYLEVEDLGSKNGTFIRGERVDRGRVEDGEKIQLGNATVLKVSWQDALDQALQQHLYDSATRDGLTGAYNKKYLLEALEKEYSYCIRHKVPLSVVMLDVDHFKKVNDTYGHPAGDHVLKQLSDLILEGIRNEDVLARYGGEEFSLVLRECDAANAAALSDRLRARLASREFEYGPHRFHVTLSAGVAQLDPMTMKEPMQVLEAADRNLYRAKEQGRNRVVAPGPNVPW